jgi:hypothetical protein
MNKISKYIAIGAFFMFPLSFVNLPTSVDVGYKDFVFSYFKKYPYIASS